MARPAGGGSLESHTWCLSPGGCICPWECLRGAVWWLIYEEPLDLSLGGLIHLRRYLRGEKCGRIISYAVPQWVAVQRKFLNGLARFVLAFGMMARELQGPS